MIVHKNEVKHLVQKKTQPPSLKAQIKINKPGHPIRPVVDITTAPTYKVFKSLANKLNGYINLKHHYNAKDSITLANDLIKLNLNENHRIITLYINDLYVNIPTKETLMITKTLLSEHNEHITEQIITLLETILQQNYFSFQNSIFRPEKDVSMGSPISGIITEIFLQC
jgi:hypothetical protein